ncbi:MAG: (4Fe-4S)-binding protein [Desulfobacterota bacterium]|nr:(4Fe-4S)-binding protein [Thermodesulfobacteriota bacterium]MDW8001652.1 (4Fe-4S)-binding protein [Deltaproteobacteria bacterium]
MEGQRIKKKIKEIRFNMDKCTGCRSCEIVCSQIHATPKYASVNPARARIRVLIDEFSDNYIAIRAGQYTEAECNARNAFTIKGREFKTCEFCPASCPSRDSFKDPESGLPLKCDGCEGEDTDIPFCVKECHPGALTYVEREVEIEPRKTDELTVSVMTLLRRHGLEKVIDTIAKVAKEIQR